MVAKTFPANKLNLANTQKQLLNIKCMVICCILLFCFTLMMICTKDFSGRCTKIASTPETRSLYNIHTCSPVLFYPFMLNLFRHKVFLALEHHRFIGCFLSLSFLFILTDYTHSAYLLNVLSHNGFRVDGFVKHQHIAY